MSEESSFEPRVDAQSEEAASLKATRQLLAQTRTELGRVIAGQDEVIGEGMVAVLAQGHALL